MISVVAPVYNEAASLRRLRDELAAAMRDGQVAFEILFIDDGSTDGSWDAIRQLTQEDERVGGIRFRRNYGKAAALQAGFAAARGEIIVTMDADLQDDPRELPRFIDTLNQGFDVVSGWKKVRHDPLDKVLPSRIFNWLVSRLSGVVLHDHNCGYKAYRREVIDELRLYGEMHRFVPVLAAARGWKVGELIVQHRPREFGRSKYGFSRNIKGFLDLATVLFLTRFEERPQHALGGAGLVACLIGFLLLAVGILGELGAKLFPPLAVVWRMAPSPMYGCLALAVGILLLALGLVAELLASSLHGSSSSHAIREQWSPRIPLDSSASDSASQPSDDVSVTEQRHTPSESLEAGGAGGSVES
jgi:hypothetical protein